jgi:hypothetical protein
MNTPKSFKPYQLNSNIPSSTTEAVDSFERSLFTPFAWQWMSIGKLIFHPTSKKCKKETLTQNKQHDICHNLPYVKLVFAHQTVTKRSETAVVFM